MTPQRHTCGSWRREEVLIDRKRDIRGGLWRDEEGEKRNWMDESYQERQRSCDLLQSLTDKQMGKKHKVAAGKELTVQNTTSNSLVGPFCCFFSH